MQPEHQLTQFEAAALKPVLHDLSATARRPVTLNGLLNSWINFVGEIEHGHVLSIDDYNNDLTTRDLLEHLMKSASTGARRKIAAEIAPIDARFAAATTESRDGPSPWSKRLPKRAIDPW